jgi:hypothetical protein
MDHNFIIVDLSIDRPLTVCPNFITILDLGLHKDSNATLVRRTKTILVVVIIQEYPAVRLSINLQWKQQWIKIEQLMKRGDNEIQNNFLCHIKAIISYGARKQIYMHRIQNLSLWTSSQNLRLGNYRCNPISTANSSTAKSSLWWYNRIYILYVMAHVRYRVFMAVY